MVRIRCGRGGCGVEGNQLPKPGVQTRSMKRKLDDEAAAQRASRVDELKEEFQRILKERKAESKRLAEMKRLEGLRNIHERNAKNDFQPLERFPKEVWCLILDELTPSDKASMWHVHPLFPGLMEKHKLRDILFPLVLDQKTCFIQNHFESISLEGITISSELLELRLISRSIRNAIDKWFEDDILTLIGPHPKPTSWYYDSWDSYKKPLRFSMNFDESKLQNLLDIETPTRIFKRDIIVSICNRGSWCAAPEEKRVRCFNLFVAGVTKTLEEVGSQIWRFKLNCWDIVELGVSRAQVYTLLKEWLGHMPNVKLMDLRVNAFRRFSHYEPIGNASLWNQRLPTLEHLKRLDIHSYLDHEQNSSERIADALISANPQLKMVNFNEHSDYRFVSRPCMKALNLELCQLQIYCAPVLFKRIETTLGNLNWNLKMLELTFSGTGVSINSLISLLNLFPNLENVVIKNYSVTFSKEEIPFLRLPNLTHFKIMFVKVERTEYDRNTHFFFSLQFMLKCRKLEFLRWWDNSSSRNSGGSWSLYRKIQSYEAEHPEEMLDFVGGFNDLEDSNLWDAFPNLELINVYIRGMEINETFRKSRGFLSSFA